MTSGHEEECNAGLAGSFTADELGNLRRCFGDSVAYIEDDLTVRCYHNIIA